MAKNDFYKDRMELAKQNESQPPVDSSPKPAPAGKGIGNLVGLMSKPRRKGQGIKEKLAKVAKVALPAAAAAAAVYAGRRRGSARAAAIPQEVKDLMSQGFGEREARIYLNM